MTLTIVVATYKGEDLLPDCLESIYTQEGLPHGWELVLVGDAAQINGARIIPEPDPPQGNIAAMDVGIRAAYADWVLFVANDVRLHPDCVRRLWDHRSYYDVIQPVLFQPNGQIDNMGLHWRWPGYGARVRTTPWCQKPPYVTDAFSATCFLLYKPTYLALGGFCRELGVSHEDIDYSLKVRANGGSCRYCPHAEATHLMGQTIGRVLGGNLSPRYHTARMRVLRRHYFGVDYAIRAGLVSLLDGAAARMRRAARNGSGSGRGPRSRPPTIPPLAIA